ncbi:pro-neuregulin-4, membrane-bound isoform isoform X6 [Chrysemys picta bellii]|uniref:pro-neuregulin-4, membrane-bound isoform isoform X6 n=1 Tax=Chrysemys picta bellii TaxID=8478 RepID=UPI0032B15E30
MGRLGNNRLWQLSSAWGARSASRGAWRPNGDDGLHHEELCGTSYGPFCLNGGICYMIPTVSSPFCRKVHIRRASSTERGVSLVETTSSNGCNKITE